MRRILIYGDSLSWGIRPGTRERFSFDQRWPGVMAGQLRDMQRPVDVIEDCLNGRRTVWDDPFKPGRNGLAGLEQRMEVNAPLHLVMLLLGTNDFQVMHSHDPWASAQGVATLVGAIRRAPVEPGMPVPDILVIAPPEIQRARGAIAPKFRNADIKAVGLNAALRTVAEDTGCLFFDAADVTRSSRVDGVHLDADQHAQLGAALAARVAAWIENGV